jgi:PHS family inorganic phosphate transporter-like MFS transporter
VASPRFLLFFSFLRSCPFIDGVNLFGGEIVSDINNTDDDNVSAMSSIQRVTQQELIGLSMGIPACFLTIFLLYYVSIKDLQIYGFLFIAFCFILLAGLYDYLKEESPVLLYVIYCILLFSLCFGPNVTTYVLPAKTYPKKIRSTYNGISAACGKLGAIAGVYMFGPVSEATNYPIGKFSYFLFSVLV